MSDTIEIIKLRPSYDASFPPGYLDRLDPTQDAFPPADFDGKAWLASLPKGALYTDIFRHIRDHPAAFRDEEIWYYACLPHVKQIRAAQVGEYFLLRSRLAGRSFREVLVVFSDYRTARVVARIGAANREEAVDAALRQIFLHIQERLGGGQRFEEWLRLHGHGWMLRLHEDNDLPRLKKLAAAFLP